MLLHRIAIAIVLIAGCATGSQPASAAATIFGQSGNNLYVGTEGSPGGSLIHTSPIVRNGQMVTADDSNGHVYASFFNSAGVASFARDLTRFDADGSNPVDIDVGFAANLFPSVLAVAAPHGRVLAFTNSSVNANRGVYAIDIAIPTAAPTQILRFVDHFTGFNTRQVLAYDPVTDQGFLYGDNVSSISIFAFNVTTGAVTRHHTTLTPLSGSFNYHMTAAGGYLYGLFGSGANNSLLRFNASNLTAAPDVLATGLPLQADFEVDPATDSLYVQATSGTVTRLSASTPNQTIAAGTTIWQPGIVPAIATFTLADPVAPAGVPAPALAGLLALAVLAAQRSQTGRKRPTGRMR